MDYGGDPPASCGYADIVALTMSDPAFVPPSYYYGSSPAVDPAMSTPAACQAICAVTEGWCVDSTSMHR
eukprot:SAG11_NODE_23039_length_396_cov_0.696970_1_plen_69_part_01